MKTQIGEFPKYMFRSGKPAVLVNSQREIETLGRDWSQNFICHCYPGWREHWDGQTKLVNNVSEDARLGPGWGRPDDFKRFSERSNIQHDPCRWVDDWSVVGLTNSHRSKIKAVLWRADGEFGKIKDGSGADHAMKFAFDEIFGVLFADSLATESVLQNELLTLVWNSAVSAGWWLRASEIPMRILPTQIGHFWFWLGESGDPKSLFRVEMGKWRAQLLEMPLPTNIPLPTPGHESALSHTVLPDTSSPNARVQRVASVKPLSPREPVKKDQASKPGERVGRPVAPKTGEIFDAWIAMGSPALNAKVCDKLAQNAYPDERTRATFGTKAHKNLRDRVRAAVQRVRALLATKSIS